MRVLVVDDNAINLRVACAYLKALGLPAEAIFTATNGREAIAASAENEFDLIFMDIQMPEMDGVEAAKTIIKSKEKKPMIVALTGSTSPEAQSEYRRAGMELVLHKPVNKSAFKSALMLLKKN